MEMINKPSEFLLYKTNRLDSVRCKKICYADQHVPYIHIQAHIYIYIYIHIKTLYLHYMTFWNIGAHQLLGTLGGIMWFHGI